MKIKILLGLIRAGGFATLVALIGACFKTFINALKELSSSVTSKVRSNV
jgi:hypothetical protein